MASAAASLPVRKGLSTRAKRRISLGLKLGLALALLVPTLFPMFWIVISSLKTNVETHTVPVTFLPAEWSLSAYDQIFERRNFGRYMSNAMIVALLTTAWGVLVAAWSGYGFARYDFRYKPAVMAFVLMAQSFRGSFRSSSCVHRGTAPR